jgi:hypothetical protein
VEQLGIEMEEILQGLQKDMAKRPVELEVVLAAFVAPRAVKFRAAVLAMGMEGAVVAMRPGHLRPGSVRGKGFERIGQRRGQFGWLGVDGHVVIRAASVKKESRAALLPERFRGAGGSRGGDLRQALPHVTQYLRRCR